MAERDPKGNLGDSLAETGKKAIESMGGAMEKGLEKAVKKATELEKIYEKVYKHIEKGTKLQEGKSSSSLGLGSMGPGAQSLQNGSYGQGGGMSAAGMAGRVALGVGAAAYGIMPSTMTAVGQRLAAEQIAMYSTGVRGGARGVITGANSMVGRGNMTSSMGPTMALGQVLSQGGYGANSLTTKNLMGQLGGMSAASGMSNEGAAGAYASQNGMNLLRLGIRLRDANGNVRQPNEIVNDLYRVLFKGGDPKNPEAMFSPNSIEFQTIMSAAGGSQEVFQLYSSMLMLRVKNKKPLTAKQMKSAGGVLNTMGLKGSVQGTNFNFQSSQNRVLEGTEKGLVGGYQGALGAATVVNNGFAAMAETLPGVVNGLASLKGVLETLPNAGGAGATMSGAAGGLGQMLMMRAAMGGRGGGSLAAGTYASGAANAAKGMSKGIPILGAALSAFGGYQASKGSKKFNWGSLAGSTALGAGGGALLGGPLGALIGAIVSGGGNAAGQLFGMNQGGGPAGTGGAQTNPSNAAMINPGQGYAVSSDFGTRKDPNGTATQHHGGIDYKMPVGTPVLAAADGIVETVTTQSGGARSYGNYIVLKHDGFFTYYAHLSKFSVKVGDVVRQGQMIGLSGGAKGAPGAGSSTGPHLHFEVRKDKSGSGQDPKSWFGKVKSSIANLFNTKSDAYKNFDWTSPSGLDSGSRAAVAGGTRLSELISQRASIGFEDISDGALGWAKTHGSSGVLDYASTLTSNNAMDAASGDAGGMAFGSRKGLISALYRQGFRGKSLQTAFAVALAESGGRSKAMGDESLQNKTYGPSMGVFQIRSYKDPKKWGAAGQWRDGKKLNDPTFNLQAAWNISNQGKNWDAWSAYKNGSFSKYLDDSQAAARKAGIKVGFYGDERTQEGLTYTHKDEVLMTKMEADRIRNRPASAGGGGITVNMNVNIARAGIEEVQTLLQSFKSALQNDKFLEQVGGY